MEHDARLPRAAALADGPYLTTVHPGEGDRRHEADGSQVRVVECRLEGIAGVGFDDA